MRKPNEPETYAIFMNNLNYVKKNLAPGSVVAMKDQRCITNKDDSRRDERIYIVEKLYDNYALCVNEIGLTECFGYYDLTVAYERGKLSLPIMNVRLNGLKRNIQKTQVLDVSH